jgi:hypothetical protein
MASPSSRLRCWKMTRAMRNAVFTENLQGVCVNKNGNHTTSILYLGPIAGHLLAMSSMTLTVLMDVAAAEKLRSNTRSQISRSSPDMFQELRGVIDALKLFLLGAENTHQMGKIRIGTTLCQQPDPELWQSVATRCQRCLLISRVPCTSSC